MFTNLEKRWTIIIFSFLLILMLATLFWPTGVKTLSFALLILSLGLTIFLIVHKQLRAYHEGRIDRFIVVFRNIFVEIISILLAIGVAVFLARRSVYLISNLAIAKWEDVLFTLLVAVVAGLATSRLVTVIVDRLMRPRKAVKATQKSS